MFNDKFFSNLQILGPGILTASAAIGTSHLVQATRAGTYFGYELLFLIIAINIIKYPFIECGYRYTISTGKNIIEGYKELNKYLLFIFIFITFCSGFIGIAAVSYICAGILETILGIGISTNYLSVIIIFICVIILSIGHYKALSCIMKYFMVILLLTTCLAVIMIVINPVSDTDIIYNESAFNIKYIPFMLALMGWMPGPIELSVWHSLWLEARNNNNQKSLNFTQASLDFNIGYFITVFTAVLFLILGATILHNSGEIISTNNAIFAEQLISIYTKTIGSWFKHIIPIIIAITIVSTTLTLIDIYPRTLAVGLKTINKDFNLSKRFLHIIMMLISCSISAIILLLIDNFKALLDLITIIAFLSAPLFAYMNYRLLYGGFIPIEYQPNKYLKILSWIGFIYFIFFCIVFIIT